MRLKHYLFPDGIINLNKELATGLHPKLEKLLLEQPVHEIEIRLAAISLYCGVVLDGVYSPMDLDNLCNILVGRLEVLRELPIAQKILPFQ